MSNEDYKKGFKDGFAAGLEEGKKLAPVKSKDPTRLDDYVFGQPNTCSVCGMKFDGPMGYVCMHPGCLSRVTCGTPMTAYPTILAGAIGSEKEYDARGWRIK